MSLSWPSTQPSAVLSGGVGGYCVGHIDTHGHGILFSSNASRPFWNVSLLAPRFIASAFAAGPALIILALQGILRFTAYPVSQSVIDMLALIMSIAMQISLFFVGAELFTDFYNETTHAASMHYLFFGLAGFDGLRPFIRAAVALKLFALFILLIHPLRKWMPTLNIACVCAIVGIWLEIRS